MQNNAYTNIPNITLNALKQLLFTQEGGTDLSNIIADLGGDDLTAINVGLVHKGIAPKIDEQSRYEKNYGTRFFRYDFVRCSLIRNKVEVKRTMFTTTAEGMQLLVINIK